MYYKSGTIKGELMLKYRLEITLSRMSLKDLSVLIDCVDELDATKTFTRLIRDLEENPGPYIMETDDGMFMFHTEEVLCLSWTEVEQPSINYTTYNTSYTTWPMTLTKAV